VRCLKRLKWGIHDDIVRFRGNPGNCSALPTQSQPLGQFWSRGFPPSKQRVYWLYLPTQASNRRADSFLNSWLLTFLDYVRVVWTGLKCGSWNWFLTLTPPQCFLWARGLRSQRHRLSGSLVANVGKEPMQQFQRDQKMCDGPWLLAGVQTVADADRSKILLVLDLQWSLPSIQNMKKMVTEREAKPMPSA
jgi:hypothetical protein